MGGKRTNKTGNETKPAKSRAAMRDGAASNMLFDWFDLPFVASVILHRKNIAWQSHFNNEADSVFNALSGHTVHHATLDFCGRATLAVQYGKLADGKAYWYGGLKDVTSILRVFEADNAKECVQELLLVVEAMQGSVNSSPHSPDYFRMEPEQEAFHESLGNAFQVAIMQAP